MKRQEDRHSTNSQDLCSRAKDAGWQGGKSQSKMINCYLGGAFAHRGTIEFWSTAVSKHVSTRS